MSETVVITGTNKREVYEELLPQLRSLIEGESDAVANMANVSAGLKLAFPVFSWAGFYLLNDGELVLGPFQGKPACVRIKPGRGVCGTAFSERRTQIVPDVHAFPGHIACDPGSQSEIVVPLLDGDACYGVLDIDSYEKNSFDDVDAQHLGMVAGLIVPYLRKEAGNDKEKG